MRDILATRIDTEMPRETATWQTPRSLLEASNITEQSRAVLDGEVQICLETAFDLFIDARSLGYRAGARRLDTALGESWHRTSGANTESAKRVWTRALGNPFFSDIEREEVVLALEKIRNLPKGHGKRNRAGAEYEARIGEDQSSPDRIGTSTFLRFGRTARQVGDLLVELGLTEENPFDVCRWSGMEEARLGRQDSPRETEYSLHEVQLFLASPIFRGDAGDPVFWVPLLMRLGGLRVGEAVDLRVEDLQYRGGIPVVRLARDAKDAREIPIPKRLQELGLIRLFKLRQEQHQAALFPKLQTGRSGHGVTQFRMLFVRYCQRHGIMAARLPADAFRKALLSELLRAGVRDDVVRMTMGHASRERHVRSPGGDFFLGLDDALSDADANLPDIIGPFSDT